MQVYTNTFIFFLFLYIINNYFLKLKANTFNKKKKKMNLWNSIFLLSIKYNFFSSRNEIILFKSMINLTNNYRMRG